jgi:hypothetical protein
MTLKKIFSYFYPSRPEDRKYFLIFIGLLILLVAYQIDPGPVGPSQHYPDSDLYIQMSEGIRDGQMITGSSLRSARILTPLLAASIPLEIHTSFLIINLIFLALAARLLHSLLKQYGFTKEERWTGVYLFMLMHPAIVYMLTPLVDAGTIFFVIAGLYLIQKRAPAYQIALLLLLGIFNKESCLILLPVLFLFEFFTRKRMNWGRILIISAPVLLAQRALAYFVTGNILVTTHYQGEIALGSYFTNQMIGEGNVELIVALAPLIPLAVLGLIGLTRNEKKRVFYLSPLILPILPVFFWEYFESRLFLVTYPLLFFLAIKGSRRLNEKTWYYLVLTFLFYCSYLAFLFFKKYF